MRRSLKNWLGQLSVLVSSTLADEATLSEQHEIAFGIAEQLLLVTPVIAPDQEE
jgi:hypothetical protein